jgi:hypothetical protein
MEKADWLTLVVALGDQVAQPFKVLLLAHQAAVAS